MPEMEDRLAPLRVRFVARLEAESERIAALAAREDREAAQDIGSAAHKIAGLAGSLGYPALSQAAKALDLKVAVDNGGIAQSKEFALFRDALARAIAAGRAA